MKKLLIFLLAMPVPLFLTNMFAQNGNGNVVEKVRSVEDFTAINVKEGIDLVLIQSESNKVTVITDENLQDKIITKVDNNTLKIYPNDIKNSTKMVVKVEFKNISAISADEGVDIKTTSGINVDNMAISLKEGCDADMEIHTKDLSISLVEGSDMKLKGDMKSLSISLVEGSDMNAEVDAKNIALSVVEGSDINIKGTCKSAAYSAVEGSEIKAFDLVAENCVVSVAESSECQVNATASLVVAAKEDSEVKYKGNPPDKQISSCEECEVKAQ